MVLYRIISYHNSGLDLSRVLWEPGTRRNSEHHLWDPRILYRIISYHIISNRIVSYRIESYRIVSYRIASYRTISYRIVSYHIVSNPIIYDLIEIIFRIANLTVRNSLRSRDSGDRSQRRYGKAKRLRASGIFA